MRVANGTLHRKYRGVYAYGHARLSQKGEWLAAVFAAGDGAALGALECRGLLGDLAVQGDEIHVITPLQRRPQAGFKRWPVEVSDALRHPHP